MRLLLLVLFAWQLQAQEEEEKKRKFAQNMKKLESFIESNGHSDVPRSHEIGRWLAVVRYAAREGKLSADKVAELKRVGATMKPLEHRWEEGFRLATQFLKREKKTEIPAKHLEEGQPLRAWLNQQKKAARSGSLLPQRAEKLAALGFLNDLATSENNKKDKARAKIWSRHLETLKQYRDREGHAAVPRTHLEKEALRGRMLKLGQWLSKQKAKAHQGRLTKEQRDELSQLGVKLDSGPPVITKEPTIKYPTAFLIKKDDFRHSSLSMRKSKKKQRQRYWNFEKARATHKNEHRRRHDRKFLK